MSLEERQAARKVREEKAQASKRVPLLEQFDEATKAIDDALGDMSVTLTDI